jgi:hypothetical protein
MFQKPQHPAEPIENYFGVALSIIGALLFLLVKSNATSQSISSAAAEEADDESEPLTSNSSYRTGYQAIDLNIVEADEMTSFLQNLSPLKKRIVGIGLSVTAGICVGLTYAPYLYVIDRYDNVSKNGLDYVFSMFTGVLITAFIYFIIYCIIKKNNPQVISTSILPGFSNGWVWGIGVSFFQFSNSVLGQAITFPIALGLQVLVFFPHKFD